MEETEIKEKKKTSTCTAKVKVNYIDLSKVLDNFDGQADKDSIIEAIGEAKTSKKTVKVSLESEDDEWKIVDDSAIYDLLFNGFEDLDYYLSPIEPDPTTTTEEPTTTTTEEPTTTTTAAPASSDTDPSASSVTGGVHQVLVGDELDQVLKDFGFTVEENRYGNDLERNYEYDEDFIFYYYESQDSSEGESRKEWLLDRCWFRGANDSKIKNYKFWQDGNYIETIHSYDFYMYYDETVLLIAGIDVYPNADPSESYYQLIQAVGLWDFGFDA